MTSIVPVRTGRGAAVAVAALAAAATVATPVAAHGEDVGDWTNALPLFVLIGLVVLAAASLVAGLRLLERRSLKP